jgi:predicted metal-binding membrane protein
VTATRTAAALTLGLAAICWVIAVHQMDGMDMGVETDLGSLGFFVAAWVPMMAAMMLPGAMPALLRCARAGAALLFAGSYVAVWAAIGLVVYAIYSPHSAATAGALTIAAGVYELTPFKRECRRRCRERAGSGVSYGLACVGSSIGLMVVLLALGAMSVTWMVVVAALVLTQKLLPLRRAIDVPVALAIVAVGVVTVLTP